MDRLLLLFTLLLSHGFSLVSTIFGFEILKNTKNLIGLNLVLNLISHFIVKNVAT